MNALTLKEQDQLKELIHLIELTKEEGGFFLLGYSGELGLNLVIDELKRRLEPALRLKQIEWRSDIDALQNLFPLTDPLYMVYIVTGFDSQQTDKEKSFTLLNLSREFYQKNQKQVLYFFPSDILFKELQWKAPDFWSFRTVSFDFFHPDDFHKSFRNIISNDFIHHEKIDVQIDRLKKILSKTKDKKQLSSILTELANTLYTSGEPEKALKYHMEALEIDRQLGYKQGEASDLGNIGLIYSDQGEPEKALKYLMEALEIFKAIKANRTVEKLENMILSIKTESSA